MIPLNPMIYDWMVAHFGPLSVTGYFRNSLVNYQKSKSDG
mgnify:CR=1 FL=1